MRGQAPAGAGRSLDEYPFASTAQGGSGAYVGAVPVAEQSYQGGVLGGFYRSNKIAPGDEFGVSSGP
ncbi:hypothetical protein DEA06_08975 [Microbacterium sp. Gd 4-13]|nr:hypothetical protein DEA06_08975 [Microbacterium sp. Gd 4-13]